MTHKQRHASSTSVETPRYNSNPPLLSCLISVSCCRGPAIGVASALFLASGRNFQQCEQLIGSARWAALVESQKNKIGRGKLTSSACLPPSYRTIKTLTFSRGKPVSDRIVVDGPSLVVRLEGRTAALLEARPAVLLEAVDDRKRLEEAMADAAETLWKPLLQLRRAVEPTERPSRGRERDEVSTILTDCLVFI